VGKSLTKEALLAASLDMEMQAAGSHFRLGALPQVKEDLLAEGLEI
jgi:hypothetical protein